VKPDLIPGAVRLGKSSGYLQERAFTDLPASLQVQESSGDCNVNRLVVTGHNAFYYPKQ